MQREHRGVRRSQLCLDFAHAAQDRRRVWRMFVRDRLDWGDEDMEELDWSESMVPVPVMSKGGKDESDPMVETMV